MSPIKLTLGRALRFWVWVRFVAVIVRLPSRWLTRRRPLFLASAGQGMAVFGVCWRMKLPVARRAGGALPPRRSRCSRSPGARGYAPLPPIPHPRQAELAGFCALTRACCASRRCVLCWRTVRPTRVRAVVARSRRAARSARGPRGRGATRPYPRTPYPRQAELAGFCALPRACCASRRCFCARARSNPHVCAGACSDPPACTKCACYAALFMK